MMESCKMTYFPSIILPVNISYFRLTFSLHVHKAHKKVTTYNKKKLNTLLLRYYSTLTYRSSTNTPMKFEIHFVHECPSLPAAAAAASRELPRSGRARQEPPARGGGERCPRSAPCRLQPPPKPAAPPPNLPQTIRPSSEFPRGEKGTAKLSPAAVHGSWEGKAV